MPSSRRGDRAVRLPLSCARHRGGRVRGRAEGTHRHLRISESVEKAIAAYNCPAYQDALKALGDGAVRDLRIVEGPE